ncbi:MAG: DMT family transporter [Flavobacteriaceae bacterium]
MSVAEEAKPASGDDPAERLAGIGLMCLALLCFSCLDTTAKLLSRDFHTFQIVFARYLGHLVVVAAIVSPARSSLLWRTRQPLLQFVRGLLLLGSTMCNFLALQYLQLAETMSIFFSTPLLVAALAGPLLGEWIGPRRWAAVLFGFAGILVVTRPGLGGMHPAALFSVGAALCYAFYAIVTRVLMSRGEGVLATQFYGALIGTLCVLPLVPGHWQSPHDDLSMALMLAMGAFGAIGHGLLTLAHRIAPAPVLSPFIYTQIVWMVSLGFLVFHDVPNPWTLVGAAIVISSGLYLLFRERRVKGEV